MRKFLLLIAFVVLAYIVYAQSPGYVIKNNIPYYGESLIQADNYLKEKCVLDIVYPTNTKGFATIIWFHGGGLTSGSKSIPDALKDKGHCIVAANYRLSPHVNSPKYIEDAAAAVAWVFKNINSLGGDASLIFVSGHSAGGYLATMIGLDKRWLQKHSIDANSIAGMIPFSGQTITHFTIREEKRIPRTQPVIDDLAPLFHVRGDAPPLLLITGDRELELMGRYEENAYLMRMMKVAGHEETKILELDGYGHSMAEPAFPLLLNEVKRIVEKRRNSNTLNK